MKHADYGGVGGMLPQENVKFRTYLGRLWCNLDHYTAFCRIAIIMLTASIAEVVQSEQIQQNYLHTNLGKKSAREDCLARLGPGNSAPPS